MNSPERGFSPKPRRRLRPEDRERKIVDGAVAFFAEVGFDGGLRDLAKRLGITHQNLFRYFPTKEALIERVYQEVYLSRWQPEWETVLHDPAKSLERRLIFRCCANRSEKRRASLLGKPTICSMTSRRPLGVSLGFSLGLPAIATV